MFPIPNVVVVTCFYHSHQFGISINRIVLVNDITHIEHEAFHGNVVPAIARHQVIAEMNIDYGQIRQCHHIL